ncbi:hypothetical protein D3C76_1834140 [compost metagenome]
MVQHQVQIQLAVLPANRPFRSRVQKSVAAFEYRRQLVQLQPDMANAQHSSASGRQGFHILRRSADFQS